MSLQTAAVPRPAPRCDLSWTEAENRTLRLLYPDYQAMADALRHRSYFACRNQCRKLKIVRPKHVWTNAEVKKLIALWNSANAQELREAFPDVSYEAVVQKGKSLGLGRRFASPLVLTGDPCCDAIRDRCRELGYSMVYLDSIAETRTYFQKADWKHPRGHRIGPMVKAIKALGGVLSVTFPD